MSNDSTSIPRKSPFIYDLRMRFYSAHREHEMTEGEFLTFLLHSNAFDLLSKLDKW